MQFIGRLASDARDVDNVEKPFLAFTLFEHRKDSPAIVNVTYSYTGSTPNVHKYLRKGTLVTVSGTPYAKLDEYQGEKNAIQCMFADNITLLSSGANNPEEKY
ncbi:hypothetical protein D0T87_15755 [Bacteroides sp. 51]|nr:hypothetical protein [Bacteroides sp. 51]